MKRHKRAMAESHGLVDAIREHYDRLSAFYSTLWGEHIHHGYWIPGAPDTGRHRAQVRTVEELIAFGEIPPGGYVLDVGCGIGASSIYLASRLGCRVEGITISDAQITRAREKARDSGYADLLNFTLMDGMQTSYPYGTFDCVWSLESCELMPDKADWLRECFRLLKPGGRLVAATWCSRGYDLTPAEAALLRTIYRDFAAAYVLPLIEYARLCQAVGFTNVRTEDWTACTRRTWEVGSDLATSLLRRPSYLWRLARRGWHTVRFVRSVPLMRKAYQDGTMRYGVFRGTRPAAEALAVDPP